MIKKRKVRCFNIFKTCIIASLIHVTLPVSVGFPVDPFICLDAVFVADGDANSFLGRRLLLNRFDFEMFVQGNLERECHEEVCNYEEAREVFENIPATVSDTVQWALQQCHSIPCSSTELIRFSYAGCLLEEVHRR